MPADSAHPIGNSQGARLYLPWMVLLASLLILYAPTFKELATSLWNTDQNSHGPIVLAVSVWYFWFRSKQVAADPSILRQPAAGSGLALVVAGLCLYVVGQSQDFYLFAVGSLIPLVAGIVVMFFGWRILREVWFAFFFLFFAVPLPGAFVDTLTHPMKLAVSYGAEHILYWAGYPAARAGVVLNIGSYQLLVADACAGLNSLFTLEALGLLYMNIIRHESALRNTVLAILIVPISFTANLVRVLVLCLVTYHLGDEAGQGFLHGFSGMVLFLTALFLVIALDGALRKLSDRWWRRAPEVVS